MSVDMPHRNFRAEEFLPFTTAIGELTLAWNDFHLSLVELFGHTLMIKNGLIFHAIWNSSKSDRAQRDMLKSMIGLNAIGINISDQVRKEIKWILDQADKLEDDRNNALHSPLVSTPEGKIIPFDGLGNQRAGKLVAKSEKLKANTLLGQFHLFYDTTVILRDYATELAEAMRVKTVCPDRPELPSRGDYKDQRGRSNLIQE